MFVQCHDVALRWFKDSVNHFEASDIKFMRSRSKGSNKHHFSGYASSFPRLFGHYSGRNGAANMFVQCLCSATMCNQVYQRAALTIFLTVTYKSWVLVLKTINYAQFFELTRILISVPFWLLIGAKLRSEYVRAMPRCGIKVIQGQR